MICAAIYITVSPCKLITRGLKLNSFALCNIIKTNLHIKRIRRWRIAAQVENFSVLWHWWCKLIRFEVLVFSSILSGLHWYLSMCALHTCVIFIYYFFLAAVNPFQSWNLMSVPQSCDSSSYNKLLLYVVPFFFHLASSRTDVVGVRLLKFRECITH